ncbi:MAG TPA: TerB family tellurite resistance protein [Bacteroidales bacterium]|nr:TerB family tellurite resistance protein [Bacteroidales bacterium]HPS27623.1 TerB family tellurite resistance protein [Bacteroidales bacterium]
MKFGKWIGGGLGWAFGGPIGAILGFVFGSIVDNITVTTINNTHQASTQQGDFVASLLVLTAAVMKAEGQILRSELNFVKRTFLQQFSEEETRHHMLVLRDILKQDIPVYDVCRQIAQNMDYSSRLQLLHYLFGISQADNFSHPSEIRVIETIASYMRISPADVNSIRAMFIKDTDSAYKILEVDSSISDEELKRAYRRMAVKYHPDKVSHLGPEMQKAANEKFQKVNAAYEEIKKMRGLP